MPRKLLFLLLPLLTANSWSMEREEWTTSKIQGSPELPLPYMREAIWPHITFQEAVDISLLKSEARLFVSERKGKIWSLPADLNATPAEADLCSDLKLVVPDLGAVYGLTFHPNFKKNRQLYLFYTIGFEEIDSESRVSKFLMDDALKLIPDSQEIIITTGAGGHNGGDMHFGPDGMLYFTVGDLAPPSPPDPENAGQDMSNLASTIVRIDVDNKDTGLAYRIPNDNPFIDVEGARPEIWAYGFRNPWKFCFRPGTDEIWLGDVGWEIWEMVHRVERGGNYGWSIMEGPGPLKPDQKQGPTPISPPVAYYPHTVGASSTGGYFVTSPRLPELQGAYIYGDYVTGKVWALKWDGKSVTSNRIIADTRKQIVSFGLDFSGDLIFLDYPNDNGLYRLVPNTVDDQSDQFPKQLSAAGLFDDVKTEDPSAGVYPFSIHAPTWQDGYESSYWIGLPGKGRMEAFVAYRDKLPLLRFEKPANTVLAKTIHKNGKRVETQILHFDGYWNGYSYQWNEAQTDATLVSKEGLETTIDGKPYRFPSRDECVRCHGSNFHRPLAFLPGQINKDRQLETFLELGLIDQEFVSAAKLDPMDNPRDETASLDQRARSWIQSNCAHCHRVSGGAGVVSVLNKAVPNDRMKMIHFPPQKGNFGMGDAPLIDPGNPYNSIFYYRIATKNAGHMPMIGSKTIDQEGVQLVHDWIRSLKPDSNIVSASLKPGNVEEALALYHKIQSGELSDADSKQAIANCMKSPDPFVLNLFIGFTLN